MKKLSHLRINCKRFLTDPLLESIGQLSELKRLSLLQCETEVDHFTQEGMLQLTNLKKLVQFSVNGNKHLTDFVLKEIAKSNQELKELIIRKCHSITEDSLLFVLDTCRPPLHLNINCCERATVHTFEAIMRKLGSISTYSPSEPGQTVLELIWYGLSLKWKSIGMEE
uniref:Uncharacterized protein n=1 Tax=Ditylenchus dipsaci TaxID=166011 RepID=A0A915DPC5_9BILA